MAQIVLVTPRPSISDLEHYLLQPGVTDCFVEHDPLTLEPRRRIGIAAAEHLIRIEIVERTDGKEVLVRRIDARPYGPEVRYNDRDESAAPANSMQLFYHAHYVVQMLKCIVQQDLVEGLVVKRIGECVQVVEHVGIGSVIEVQTYRAGSLPGPASQIEEFVPLTHWWYPHRFGEREFLTLTHQTRQHRLDCCF